MPSTSPPPVAAPLTRAAMFLVMTMNDGPGHGDIVIGEEDPAFAGGRYVVVQKYLHDLETP